MIESGFDQWLRAAMGASLPNVYRGYRPQGAGFPYAVWQVVSNPALYDATGQDPWGEIRIQVDIVTTDSASRDELTGLLDGQLNEYGGQMGGHQIRSATRENRIDLHEVDGDLVYFRSVVDYQLWYERTI